MNTLIFDLDGVIVDTAKYHYIAWKEIAEELKIEFTKADNERLKGVSRMKSFEIILEIGNAALSDEEKEKYCDKKNKVYLEYIKKMEKDEILPGVNKFIGTAKDKGYKIVLGSASKNAMLILERLELKELFDVIIDGNKISKAKPDPEVFLTGARQVGANPRDCIVFEDSVAGIEAAHLGNMKAVGVGENELLKSADYVISGFENVTIEKIKSYM